MGTSQALQILEDVRPIRQAPASINPQTEETKRKYFNIFTEYSTKNLTHKQLAERYNYDVGYVKKILDWCGKQLDGVPKETYQEAMIEKVSVHLQKLDRLLDELDGGGVVNEDGEVCAVKPRDKIMVMAEMRRTFKLLAQAQGLMEEGDGGRPVQVNINLPNLRRGEGVKGVVGKPIVVDAEEAEDE